MQPEYLNMVWVFFTISCALLILGGAVVILVMIMRRTQLATEKEKTAAIRRNEQKYADLFANVSDIVFVHSLSSKILELNATAERESGYRLEELIGRPLSDFVVLDDQISLNTYLRDVRIKGENTGLARIRCKNGDIKIFEYRNSLVMRDGKGAAVRGIARNVTEQKMAEAALRESEERYRKFFDEDLTGDFIATPEGEILSCNIAFASILGFSTVTEALEHNLIDYYPDQEAFSGFVEQVKQAKKLEYHEVQLQHRSGKPLYIIQNILGVFDENGNLIRLQGYLFDNTERKRLEEQLLHVQKMQSIGTLAGAIAHDFNNILSIVIGHGTLLEQALKQKHNPEDNLKAIMKAGRRGAYLVEQILTFARKSDPCFEALDITELAEELGNMLLGTFPKTIDIHLDFAPELPKILADQNQIHQALLNLCINARDAMSGGGQLTISGEMIRAADITNHIAEAQPVDHVVIHVKDTGIGISEETRKRLFEPFFTTKLRGQGTGLGLSVVYGIVAGHFGHIRVASREQEGARFSLYFPVSERQKRVRKTLKRHTASRPGNETLLIVEDEDLLLDLLVQVFESRGYHVQVARDGQEAVEIFTRNFQEIDLVFSDSGLPKVDGWDAYQQMKEIFPDVNAVFASGYFDPEIKNLMQQNGVIEFIQKPYDVIDVVERIRLVLDQVAAD